MIGRNTGPWRFIIDVPIGFGQQAQRALIEEFERISDSFTRRGQGSMNTDFSAGIDRLRIKLGYRSPNGDGHPSDVVKVIERALRRIPGLFELKVTVA